MKQKGFSLIVLLLMISFVLLLFIFIRLDKSIEKLFFKESNDSSSVGKSIKSEEESTDKIPDCGLCFYKYKGEVYYVTWTMGGGVTTLIDKADYDTFEEITYSIAKDKNNVYYADADGYRIIENADPLTIINLGIDKNSEYIKDKNHIYYAYYAIPGVDINSFDIVQSDYPHFYSKDKNNVYYCRWDSSPMCNVVTEADPETFRLITYINEREKKEYIYADGSIARDKNSIYSNGKKIMNSDPSTFMVIDDNNESRDKNNQYILNCEIMGGPCYFEIK